MKACYDSRNYLLYKYITRLEEMQFPWIATLIWHRCVFRGNPLNKSISEIPHFMVPVMAQQFTPAFFTLSQPSFITCTRQKWVSNVKMPLLRLILSSFYRKYHALAITQIKQSQGTVDFWKIMKWTEKENQILNNGHKWYHAHLAENCFPISNTIYLHKNGGVGVCMCTFKRYPVLLCDESNRHMDYTFYSHNIYKFIIQWFLFVLQSIIAI